jgi:hypothetical protein
MSLDLQEIPFTRTRRVIHDVVARALQAVEYELEEERSKRDKASLRAAGSLSLRGGSLASAGGRERGRVRPRDAATVAQSTTSLPRVPTSPLKLRRATSTKVLLEKVGSLGQDALVASLGAEVSVAEEAAPGRLVRSPLTRSRGGDKAKEGWSPETDSALRAIAEDRAGAPLPSDSLPRVAYMAPDSQPELGAAEVRALWEGFAPSRTTRSRQAILDPRNPLGRPGPRGTVIWPAADEEGPEGAEGAGGGPGPATAPAPATAKRPHHATASLRSLDGLSLVDRSHARARLVGHHPHKTDRQVARILRTLHAQEKLLHERVALG